MNEVVYQKTSKSDLLFNKDVKLEPETLEEGSKDLYDIIKFCCAVKENPISPNLKEWSRKLIGEIAANYPEKIRQGFFWG